MVECRQSPQRWLAGWSMPPDDVRTFLSAPRARKYEKLASNACPTLRSRNGQEHKIDALRYGGHLL
jgi:hypothetical protein